ncbi:hypothetical protein QEH56_23390 [Pelagicoccus enzymogenes]|uniref:hypothetical protein n=1 Tax=Pelagicoccus enzymogenes TaxID=2773457 RepID=UPI00280D4F2C|nr:hypothetical protein [Pelagicoccus enzymogenes]MDQ8201130.1 hypothetical protein [Pelagicoccus enzymogenes]
MKRFFEGSSLSKAIVFLAALGLAASAEACSVCAVGKEEARAAYYATTAILSFLPLIMIGGVVYFLFKKKR